MARTRNLKPGFFKNEFLGQLPFEARLLFEGLWCLADRRGVLEDRPLRIKAEIFPFDAVDVDELLVMLATPVDPYQDEPFIVRYEANGRRYIFITTFSEHQSPHRDEGEIDAPLPQVVAKTVDMRGTDQAATPEDRSRTVRAQDKHRTSTVQAPYKPDGGTNAATPFYLLPSTLSLPPSEGGERSKASAPPPDRPEPKAQDPPTDFSFPIKSKSGKTWNLPKSKLDEYRKTFEGLDVDAELLKARQWCTDNVARRKTGGGMLKFLTAWLSRANDQGRGKFLDEEQRRAEERKRHLAAEASRREAREQAERARASPGASSVAPVAVKRARDPTTSDDQAKANFNEALSRITGGSRNG